MGVAVDHATALFPAAWALDLVGGRAVLGHAADSGRPSQTGSDIWRYSRIVGLHRYSRQVEHSVLRIHKAGGDLLCQSILKLKCCNFGQVSA